MEKVILHVGIDRDEITVPVSEYRIITSIFITVTPTDGKSYLDINRWELDRYIGAIRFVEAHLSADANEVSNCVNRFSTFDANHLTKVLEQYPDEVTSLLMKTYAIYIEERVKPEHAWRVDARNQAAMRVINYIATTHATITGMSVAEPYDGLAPQYNTQFMQDARFHRTLEQSYNRVMLHMYSFYGDKSVVEGYETLMGYPPHIGIPTI